VKHANKEYGSSLLSIDNDENLLNGIGESVRAWMSHGDEAEKIIPFGLCFFKSAIEMSNGTSSA